MPGISLGPIASGLPKDLVQKLVDAEREPIRQLEARKQNEESRLKLAQDLSTRVGTIAGTVSELSKFRQFRDLSAMVGRPELMDVSVDKTKADPGTYQVEVIQMAGRSSMLSNGFEDANETEVGEGYFSYQMPNGDTKEIYIDSENSTLQGMANLINRQKGLNLNALVVDDGTGSDSPYRLIISHTGSGEVNDAEFPEFYFVGGDEDFFMDKEKPAQNSVIKVNGFDVEFEGNKITSLLPGVTIDLKDSAPGKEFTLSIKEDIKSIKGKIQAMVEKINQVLTFVQDQNKLDKDSNTKNTLGGDVTLQTLEYKIRGLILTPVMTEYGPMRMSDMGVSFERTGLLGLQEAKLERALNTNFPAIAQYFTGVEDDGTGFAGQLQGSVQSLTRTDGVVQTRVDGIRRRIKEIDRQIENKERQVEISERNLKEKFSKLEGTIAGLKNQQAQVQGMLGGGGGGGLLG